MIELPDLQEHRHDYEWLDEHFSDIFSQTRGALQHDAYAIRGIEMLNLVMPYALTRSDFSRWENVLYDALLHAMELKDQEAQIQIWSHLGSCFLQSAKFRNATGTLQNAFEKIERSTSPETRLIARIGMLRAKTVFETSDIDAFIAETLADAQQIADDYLLGKLHHTLAKAYTHQAETRRAFGHAQTALGFWYRLGNTKEQQDTVMALAEICWVAKRYEQADRLLRLISNHTADRYNAAIYTYQEGCILLERNELDQALRHFERGLLLFKDLDARYMIAASSHALALVQTLLKDFSSARINLHNALVLWQQSDVLFQQANAVFAWGFLEENAEEFAAARKMYTEALELARRLPPSRMVNELTSDIARKLENLSG